ncbi:MAG: UDP-galactopyranose mutase [Parcubacteria group bacterium]|nr:UDP-galactopyranose mutase [Parcubacteria group bacterium]
MKHSILIIGAGITGITLAERFANFNYRVTIIDKRDHIGGNCYDYKDKDGFLIQKYGPHIFHTKYKDVWEYLSHFTDWIDYKHKVLARIDSKLIPLPFSLTSLYLLIEQNKAEKIEKKLISRFGYVSRIPILDLQKSKDKDLKMLFKYIYKNIYYNYSKKQWGTMINTLDPSIINRVPIVISNGDLYFSDQKQGIPNDGYTKMFKRMLNNCNIKVFYKTSFQKIKDNIKYDILLYTGPIDEFFNYKYGKLQYRYFKMQLKRIDKKEYQPVAVVNYPSLKYKFTRITEFKKLTQQNKKTTIIGLEYPGEKGVPAWPVLTNDNISMFSKYWQEAEKLKKSNIYFIGRLAEFKYYNMDQAVKNALQLTSSLI